MTSKPRSKTKKKTHPGGNPAKRAGEALVPKTFIGHDGLPRTTCTYCQSGHLEWTTVGEMATQERETRDARDFASALPRTVIPATPGWICLDCETVGAARRTSLDPEGLGRFTDDLIIIPV